ncbi:hypothetical protein C8Q76DRAFT_796939 [Earliella scabrosa]|nr:hypothetical protein C8Q76DRAFT_796939 [Earliella scabrosa]
MALDPRGAAARNKRNVQDSRQWTVGPMPVQEFLQYFLRLDDHSSHERMSSRDAFKSVPPRADTAAGIHEPLIVALTETKASQRRCPGFVFDNASARSPHTHQLGYMTPHICLYRPDNLDTVLSSDPLSRKEFGYAELFVEVTGDPTQDFFVDPPPDTSSATHEFATSSDDPAFVAFVDRALGQHISYVAEIFARQSRVCVFTVALFGSRARLFRWDRTGCIVSTSFDIRAQPELLCDFFWRFARADDAARGHDPTTQMASPAEEVLFRCCIRAHVQSQLGVEEIDLEQALSAHYEPNHVFSFYVLQQGAIANLGSIRRYLASRPVISPTYLAGKGTRGFWAVDALTHRVVFLKDTWRPISEIEGETLVTMNDVGVRNIPSVEWHGDIPDFLPESERQFELDEFQVTLTDEFCTESWACQVQGYKYILGKQVHYRLVLGTVGYDLKHFKDTRELLHATYDGTCLHQDISVGNIILVSEGGTGPRKGYLIDWDGSCEVDQSGVSPERGRVGTWEFMSFALVEINGPNHQHTIQDDMESLIYVVLYCAYLWLPHELSSRELSSTMEMFFAFREQRGDKYFGGMGKASNRIGRTYTDLPNFEPALQTWINLMLDMCCPRIDLSPGNTPYREEDKDVPVNNPEALALKRKRWTPEHVEKFWAEFWATHTLPINDRVVHDHPRATGEFYEGVQVLSCPSYGSGYPRKLATHDDGAALRLDPATLRARKILNPSTLDRLPPHSIPTPLPPHFVPRQIARIIEKRKRAKGTIGTETNNGGKSQSGPRRSGRLPRVVVSNK